MAESRMREKYHRVKRLQEQRREQYAEGLYGDQESVNWLNTILSKVWIKYDALLGQYMIDTLDPMVDYYRPEAIDSIKFTQFNMTDRPPKFNFFKVYQTRKLHEIQLDIDVEVDMSLDIIVTVTKGSASLPIRVRNVCLAGTMRVQQELLSEAPYTGMLSLAFLESPKLDFDLKLLGPNLMGLPGIADIMRKFIFDTIDGLMVIPAKLEVDMSGDVTLKPRILKVKLKGGEDLCAKAGGSSDAYAVVSIGPKKYRTSVAPKGSIASWNERFTFTLMDQKYDKLLIEVYDKETVMADVFLGRTVISLERFEPGVPIDRKFQLKDTKRGSVDVAMTVFDPNVEHPIVGSDVPGVAIVSIIEASDISEAKIPGGVVGDAAGLLTKGVGKGISAVGFGKAGAAVQRQRDPYVQVVCGRDIHTTKVQASTRNPVWNETFEVQVDDALTQKLELKLMDKTSVGKDDPIGKPVLVPLTDLPVKREDAADMWFDITGDKGRVHIEISFRPFMFAHVKATSALDSLLSRAAGIDVASGVVDSDGPFSDTAPPVAGPSGAVAVTPRSSSSGGTSGRVPASPASPLSPASSGGASVSVSSSMSATYGRATDTGTLKVQLIAAKDLPAMDSNGTSDPYVTMRVGNGDKKRSAAMHKTLNPTWNETFTFPFKARAHSLELKIKDHNMFNRFTNKMMGTASIKLTEIPDGESDAWYPLHGCTGSIHLSFLLVTNQA